MPLKALGVLQNLGKWAIPNTKKTASAKWAAWANKKYRGHRVLPDNLMGDLEEAKSS